MAVAVLVGAEGWRMDTRTQETPGTGRVIGYNPDEVAHGFINPAQRPLRDDGIKDATLGDQEDGGPGNGWVQVLMQKKKSKRETQGLEKQVRDEAGGTTAENFKSRKTLRLPSLRVYKHKVIIKPHRVAVDLKRYRSLIGEAVQSSLPRGLDEKTVVRLLEAQNTIMVCTDEWSEAEAVAGIKKLNFPVGVLDVEAYHVSPSEDACRGVIHGVRPDLTNEQIRQKTRAVGYEVLEARRLGKSQSAVIVFAGKKVPFTVSFNWLETPCFIYKKTRAACLNCGEVGHRTDVCSKPEGFACSACRATEVGEDHECVPKCALCGGAHKTYDRHCPEKFYKETKSREPRRSRGRRRDGAQHVRWLSRESGRSVSDSRTRSRSRSASCGRSASRDMTTSKRRRQKGKRKKSKRSTSMEGIFTDPGNRKKWPELPRVGDQESRSTSQPKGGGASSNGAIQDLRRNVTHCKKTIEELWNKRERTGGVSAEQVQAIVETTVQRAIQGLQEFFTSQLMQLTCRVTELEKLGKTLEQNQESLFRQFVSKRRKTGEPLRDAEISDAESCASQRSQV